MTRSNWLAVLGETRHHRGEGRKPEDEAIGQTASAMGNQRTDRTCGQAVKLGDPPERPTSPGKAPLPQPSGNSTTSWGPGVRTVGPGQGRGGAGYS